MVDHDGTVVADGGRRKTQYYWYNPNTDAALYHTAVHADEADPFFDTVADAEHYLEQRAASSEETERYEGLSLYKVRNTKEEDAVEVLLDQAGIGDFVPDGGKPATEPATPRGRNVSASDYLEQETSRRADDTEAGDGV